MSRWRVVAGGAAVAAASAIAATLAGSAPVAAATSPAARVAAAPASGAGCVVKVVRFAFSPKQVAPGATSRLHLVLDNCTGTRQVVAVTQYGSEPAGCPVLDPIAFHVTLKAHARSSRPPGAFLAPSCAGKVTITDRFTPSSGSSFTRSASFEVVAG